MRNALAAALALTALGCAASPESDDSGERSAARPAEQPLAEPEPVDQVAAATEPAEEAPDPLRVEPTEDEAEAAAVTAPPPAPEGEDETPEPDAEPITEPEAEPETPEAVVLGRPDWWFDGVRRGEGRVALCAEAGGATVREARRAAIDTARRKLDRALGGAGDRETVSMAMVLPLPAADAGPGAARYIGYVMMEARTR